ncbi:MAG: hypothetical protein ACFB50_09915 [Rubrobacteraceae bacterium]
MAPLISVYNDDDVLPALREFYSQHPAAMKSSPETLARLLYMFRFLSYRPDVYEVEAALEALQVEEELAA